MLHDPLLQRNSSSVATLKVVRDWWWVMMVVLLSMVFYFIHHLAYKREKQLLTQKLKSVQMQIASVKRDKLELEEKLLSQLDPEWIKMLIKGELGLVEENQTKVFMPDAQQ